jgi:hypothetical protein
MEHSLRQEVKRLFREACALPPDARDPFLVEIGRRDPVLRARVETLLALETDPKMTTARG